eukprot:5817270-Lingulodinium_polyedra.AAC.1
MGLVCPGVLRTIDNAFLGMGECVPGWQGWYNGLAAISKCCLQKRSGWPGDGFGVRCQAWRVGVG